jgi:hypothetical protein
MSVTARLVLFLVSAVVVVFALRVRAAVRNRRLYEVMEQANASWAALCRVASGGHFLDGGRKRVGMGPSGTLFMI